MDTADIHLLQSMLEKYDLKDVTSALSYVCGENATRVAEFEHDPELAKDWMWRSIQCDHLTWKLERGRRGA